MGSDNGVGFYRQDKSPALQHWLDAVLLVFLAVPWPLYMRPTITRIINSTPWRPG